jgi:hypothetical protein
VAPRRGTTRPGPLPLPPTCPVRAASAQVCPPPVSVVSTARRHWPALCRPPPRRREQKDEQWLPNCSEPPLPQGELRAARARERQLVRAWQLSLGAHGATLSLRPSGSSRSEPTARLSTCDHLAALARSPRRDSQPVCEGTSWAAGLRLGQSGQPQRRHGLLVPPRTSADKDLAATKTWRRQ